MVLYCMVLYGVVWYGIVWYGMVWYGMVCRTTLVWKLIVFSGCLRSSLKIFDYYKDVIFLRVLNLAIANSLGGEFDINFDFAIQWQYVVNTRRLYLGSYLFNYIFICLFDSFIHLCLLIFVAKNKNVVLHQRYWKNFASCWEVFHRSCQKRKLNMWFFCNLQRNVLHWPTIMAGF
jgi:hypothetical protein